MVRKKDLVRCHNIESMLLNKGYSIGDDYIENIKARFAIPKDFFNIAKDKTLEVQSVEMNSYPHLKEIKYFVGFKEIDYLVPSDVINEIEESRSL